MKGLMGQCPQNFWARTAPADIAERMQLQRKCININCYMLTYGLKYRSFEKSFEKFFVTNNMVKSKLHGVS